jgi:predicted helicase
MRWHLLKTFDKIYVLDLHGNSKKKEVCPDGSPDKNVFDIRQGVAVIIGVKHKDNKAELAEVWHGDLWGSRTSKNNALWEHRGLTISPVQLSHQAPTYPFVPRNYELLVGYQEGFALADLMPVTSVGIVTARDSLTIDFDQEVLWARVEDFVASEVEVLRERYALGKDVRDWRVNFAKADVMANFDKKHLVPIAYRPFDIRWTYYTGKSRGFQCYPRHEVMRNFAGTENIAIQVSRQQKSPGVYSNFLVHRPISESSLVSNKTSEIGNSFPLYLYPEEGTLETERRVNFDPKIYAQIRECAGLSGADGDELRVFDYIYGVLHSPDYRATYAQFLKIDFPRIPYPASPEVFSHVSELGGQLRRLHLIEDAAIGDTPYPFNGEGDNVVVNPALSDDGRVFINPDQWFEGVPAIAWEFHIGGYKPAQKWLKDRRRRALSFDDVRHYQKIIKILVETDRIMQLIKLPL